MAGDKEKAKAEFEKISKEDRLKLGPPRMAIYYITLGNFDEALTQLEHGFDNHALGMISLKVEPAFDPIRNEPRFKVLMKKMGFD